jgi:hypothetical protein
VSMIDNRHAIFHFTLICNFPPLFNTSGNEAHRKHKLGQLIKKKNNAEGIKDVIGF